MPPLKEQKTKVRMRCFFFDYVKRPDEKRAMQRCATVTHLPQKLKAPLKNGPFTVRVDPSGGSTAVLHQFILI